MEKSTGRVLKADNVNVKGSVCLDIGRPAKIQSSSATSVACTPQAEIIERTETFAVIEMTCNCGTKTHVRCEY